MTGPKYYKLNGFTLVESLVALAIASSLLIPLAGWLWHQQLSEKPMLRMYASGLLEDQITRCIILHKVPQFAYCEKDLRGHEWIVEFHSDSLQGETCVNATAIHQARDTVGTMSGCFHE